jgi:hypothetical protein
MTFDEMFIDLVNRINCYKISHQQAFGLVSAAREHISAHIAEKIKNDTVAEKWKQTIEEYAPHTPDLPLVETTEDN